MRFFTRMSPLRAIRDLRVFLAQRQPYELGFLALAIVLTGLLLFGFVLDSHVEREYKPDITYVEQWPATRTDPEIIAQQKIDQARRDKLEAERAARRKALQDQFKRIDDKLNRMGI